MMWNPPWLLALKMPPGLLPYLSLMAGNENNTFPFWRWLRLRRKRTAGVLMCWLR